MQAAGLCQVCPETHFCSVCSRHVTRRDCGHQSWRAEWGKAMMMAPIGVCVMVIVTMFLTWAGRSFGTRGLGGLLVSSPSLSSRLFVATDCKLSNSWLSRDDEQWGDQDWTQELPSWYCLTAIELFLFIWLRSNYFINIFPENRRLLEQLANLNGRIHAGGPNLLRW